MADPGGSESSDEGHVFVFDRRTGNGKSSKITLGGIFDYSLFKARVLESFEIGVDEEFVIVNTNRAPICNDFTYEEIIESGDTLYLLNDAKQDLLFPVHEQIEYLPHYDTLVKSGLYEYYASAGNSPLPFAIAELIDNAIAATASNAGAREIEVVLCFDSLSTENWICVSDNGSGMTPKDLNNWAIYRLSKFNRLLQAGKTSPTKAKIRDKPRSLNSDISYFGVGGKQAIFFIGSATRVITKTKESIDVHELSLSRTDFERKAKNKEPIYSGFINNRRAGDCSHISPNCKVIRDFIEKEHNKTSFTNVIISGIEMETVKFLKQNFQCLCKQLSHIYHYYLHGPMGKTSKGTVGVRMEGSFKLLDIRVLLRDRGSTSHQISLRDVDNDFESLLVDTTRSIFEFNANVQGVGKVEGVLRYHPFLYDKETFPQSPNVDFKGDATGADGEDELRIDNRAPRGDKPMFECFWNGRLIPYTTIDYLDWCAPPKKKSLLPPECYYRVSGALFTNDSFQVSTNKLTFMDLEVRLRERSTIFSKVVMGQEQRVSIDRAFSEWIKTCHETCDKQVKFFGFDGSIEGCEFSKKSKKLLWSVYKGVEWDGKVFKVGELVRTTRTVPIVVGRLKRFLLCGPYEEDEVFATGGQMEIVQEPLSLYGEAKTLPLAKLDRTPSISSLKEFVRAEELRLPVKLLVSWPEGNEVSENSRVLAGSTIGPLKVSILNGKDESISTFPGERPKRLLVELKILKHTEGKDEKTVVQHLSQHLGKNWPYWFRKMENIREVGCHVLQLRSQLSDFSNSTHLHPLPSLEMKFYVTEAQPETISVGLLETPLRIGLPFQIPLQLHDRFGNIVKPNYDFGEPTLTSNEMNFTSNGVCARGDYLVLRDVVALGQVSSQGGQDFNLKISFSGLQDKSHSIRIRLLPGLPHLIEASSDLISIENGEKLRLDVFVKDKAGNLVSQPTLDVYCKLQGFPDLPTLTCNCSTTGKGTFTSPPLKIKELKAKRMSVAKINLRHYTSVPAISPRLILKPSSKASRIDVFQTQPGSSEQARIESNQEVLCSAGSALTGLSFAVFDEANRQVAIDKDLASRLKVNWSGRLNKDEIRQMKLPNIKAPALVEDVKYCQVSFSAEERTVEHVFSLRSCPAAPATLKSTCLNLQFKMNERLAADIVVSLYDVYGNFIKLGQEEVTDFVVSGEGLDQSSLQQFISQGYFIVRNVTFAAGSPGLREVTIKMKDIVCYQKLEMLPGVASDLVLVDFDNTEPLEILNGSQFPKPITIQLTDSAGNFVKDKNVKCLLDRDSGIKLVPPPPQQRTDADGKATFGPFSISADRGLYQVVPRAILTSGAKEGPVILVSIAPDRNKPVKLVAEFDESVLLKAGEKFPVVDVCVLAEDQNPMGTIKKNELLLKLIRAGKSSDSASNLSVFTCSSCSLNSQKNHFLFRDVVCPEKAGQYQVVVQYVVKNVTQLSSKKFNVTVNPNKAVTLVPLSVPSTPIVTNSSRIANRQLVKNLKFQLKDKFGNISGTEMKGKLRVNVEAGDKGPVPALHNGETSASFQLENGTSIIESLMLKDGSKGLDGKEYVLSFEAVCNACATTKIEPFKLSFLFYDDVAKQAKMAEITKSRDHLLQSINAYRSLFDAMSQLYKEIHAALKEASFEEMNLKNELRAKKFQNVNALKSKEQISSAFSQLKERKEGLEKMPRRQCLLARGPSDKDVIGKVAHLAQVRDEEVARVLSWHLASDMDCVVTVTLEQATKIYKETKGRQQVLPLESIYRKGLSDWRKPLPHVRYPAIKSPGSVTYARDLLVFPEHQDYCQTVFIMLLGDTVIADNLDAANKYRQEVVKYTYCPTILTRTGERIRNNGKFGGLQNRAPAIERLGGMVFASPLPHDYPDVCAQLDLLMSLEAAVAKVEEKKLELQAHVEHCQSSKVQEDYRECLETEKQLQTMDRELGLASKVIRFPPTLSDYLKSDGSGTSNGNQEGAAKRTSVDGARVGNAPPRKRGRSALGQQRNSKRYSDLKGKSSRIIT